MIHLNARNYRANQANGTNHMTQLDCALAIELSLLFMESTYTCACDLPIGQIVLDRLSLFIQVIE